MTITVVYIKDIDITTLFTENIMSKINHKTGEVSHTKCTKTCTFDVFDPNFQ